MPAKRIDSYNSSPKDINRVFNKLPDINNSVVNSMNFTLPGASTERSIVFAKDGS